RTVFAAQARNIPEGDGICLKIIIKLAREINEN
ncbi:MAG: hypothetical protein QG555_765, partial [Thermodesulfobacteriota bacterium]|nr:hypothetical protein [Thermodesulfobacteriota bacterium]